MNVQTSVKAEIQRAAREAAYAMPLRDFHPGAPQLLAIAGNIDPAVVATKKGSRCRRVKGRPEITGFYRRMRR